MTIQKTSLSFGKYLQALRLEKEIDIEEISARTNISKSSIVLLEREDHKRLPARIFVRGFIRTYAGVLGADPDDVLNRYDADLRQAESISRKTGDLASQMSIRRRAFYGVTLLLVNILTSLFIYQWLQHRSFENKTAVAPEVSSAAVQGTVAVPEEKSANHVEQSREKYVLRATATKPTWLKIVVDGQPAQEYKLKPQDRLEFEAQTNFNLLVGDGGGVNISLNNKPIDIMGRDGEIVSLQLP
ncbi:MAG: DUF4115 domain-containing protein [Desulfobacteraceae bacterium]|nr:DUF4115 domain-containing protein [Desulfobacteraceae bacterium]